MNKKQKSSPATESLWKKTLSTLTDKYRDADKYCLVSKVTGLVFILLAVLQLILVIASPLARTFDHISLIFVNHIIAAICFVYVLYRRGTPGETASLSNRKSGGHRSEKEKPGEPSDSQSARVCIPDSRTNSDSRHSSSFGYNPRSARTRTAENENLFSPRHRYSADRHDNGHAAHTAQSSRRAFNSRRTDR